MRRKRRSALVLEVYYLVRYTRMRVIIRHMDPCPTALCRAVVRLYGMLEARVQLLYSKELKSLTPES